MVSVRDGSLVRACAGRSTRSVAIGSTSVMSQVYPAPAGLTTGNGPFRPHGDWSDLAPGRRLGEMTRLRRSLLALGLVVVGLGALPGVASAHAQLESSTPGQSAVLLVPPTQVVLHFGEPVEIDFGSLRVIGPGGRRVDAGAAHHPGGDTHSVATALPPGLADGTYVVAWRVISADSHPVHGAYVFSVGTAHGSARADALAAAIADQPGDAVVGVAFWIVRAAAFAGLLVLVGLAVLVSWLWPAGGRTRRVGRVLWWSWGTLLVATVAGVLVQGVYASALPLTDAYRPSLVSAVLDTRFGQVEVLRLLLLAGMVPVLLWLRGRIDRGGAHRRWRTAACGAVGLLLLATPGLAGHAATGAGPGLGLGLDVVHLAAASAWIGGLVLLATFLVPRDPGDAWPPDPSDLTLRVSAVAFTAVVAVVATGVVQSIRQVGSLYALFHTPYGRTLVVKICLVVALIAVGAVESPTGAPSGPHRWPPGRGDRRGPVGPADRARGHRGARSGRAGGRSGRLPPSPAPAHGPGRVGHRPGRGRGDRGPRQRRAGPPGGRTAVHLLVLHPRRAGQHHHRPRRGPVPTTRCTSTSSAGWGHRRPSPSSTSAPACRPRRSDRWPSRWS